MKTSAINLLFLAVLASGCSAIPENARFDQITPEKLVQAKTNTVSLNINSPDDISRLRTWLENEIPSQAEIGCISSTKTCSKVMKLLAAYGVNATEVGGLGSDVRLTYSKVIARDCNSYFIDRPINPYNFSSGGMGCSVSANTIRMISDRTQLSNPRTSGDMDAARGVKVYNAYTTSTAGDVQLQILNKK